MRAGRDFMLAQEPIVEPVKAGDPAVMTLGHSQVLQAGQGLRDDRLCGATSAPSTWMATGSRRQDASSVLSHVCLARDRVAAGTKGGSRGGVVSH
jgi:hypothetical protein